MEFLVRIDVRLPPDMAQEDRATLTEAERARGAELRRAGKLVRIWRLPGQQANISLYQVADATELHGLLSSLPLWPWMEITVDALARHPLEAEEAPRPAT